MSSDVAERPQDDAQNDEDEDFVEFLHDLVIKLETRVEAVEDENEDLRKQINQLESRHGERIDELDERTDIMTLVEEAEDVSPKQRRTMLLLHMKKMAEDRARNGKKKSFTVTQEQANEALHAPEIDRTTFYTDFQKLEEWVGNKNVCKYISDTGGESRLELDLTNGRLVDQDLPTDVANGIRGGD